MVLYGSYCVVSSDAVNRKEVVMMQSVIGLFLMGVVWVNASAAEKSLAKAGAVPAPTQEIEFKTILVDGKKTWVPPLTSVKHGVPVHATLINELAEPHGFEIPGVVAPMVVQPKTPTKVSFALKATGDYEVKCHLHPAHVGAKLQAK